MDKIEIRGLEVFAHHGVYEEEQRLGQRFIVDAVLGLDLTAAGSGDELADTVNYGSVARQITALLQRENYQLIERAATVTAEELLNMDEQVKEVTIRLAKPWAPIGLPLKTVAVEITRSWHEVYLSLGSNLGDREEYLDGALDALGRNPKIRVLDVSDWIETEPWGVTDQPDFLNGCIHLQTFLSPAELLRQLHQIEDEAGRERKEHWGPRTLDLDILFYDDLVMGTKDLILPHPEAERRLFVLEPLAQIAPWLRHPVSHRTVSEMLERLERKTRRMAQREAQAEEENTAGAQEDG